MFITLFEIISVFQVYLILSLTKSFKFKQRPIHAFSPYTLKQQKNSMEEISIENSLKSPKQDFPKEHVPILDLTETFNDFFEQYLLTNQPCIIRSISRNWRSTKSWLIHPNSSINFAYLKKKYGKSTVPTYDCNVRFFNSHKTEKMLFEKFIDYFQKYKESDYSQDFPLLYLKDWHLKNSHPQDNFYQVPNYFSSDWLNEYLVEKRRDDYRFVYMGPKGTWTPFHADVFKSYSWSVNLVGRKRWHFLAPGEENLFKDKFGNFPNEIIDIIPECKYYSIIQEAGDAVFVPSGWYHQVVNLDDTISINHNWLNGCNIVMMYMDMQKHLNEVKEEIKDCRDDSDFVSQCQMVLKASYGMDSSEFLNFISYIGEARVKLVHTGVESTGGLNLVRFDLRMVQNVLNLFVKHEDVKDLQLLDKAREVGWNIEDCLRNL